MLNIPGLPPPSSSKLFSRERRKCIGDLVPDLQKRFEFLMFSSRSWIPSSLLRNLNPLNCERTFRPMLVLPSFDNHFGINLPLPEKVLFAVPAHFEKMHFWKSAFSLCQNQSLLERRQNRQGEHVKIKHFWKVMISGISWEFPSLGGWSRP